VSNLSHLGNGLLAQEGGSPVGLLVLLLPIAAIIYLSVIPQRKQRQKQAELMRNLEVDDEVVTIGGIIGNINHIEGDEIHIEVDTDVVVRFSKAAIASKVPAPGEEAEAPPKSRWSQLLGGGAPAGSKPGSDSEAEKD
jgi:preprotein translocase subunit YajC